MDTDYISKAFERELMGYLMAFYFPIMFGIAVVIYKLNLIRLMSVDLLFFVTFVLPAVLIALGVLLKFRFVYKIPYRPKFKNVAFFLTITSLVIVLSDIIGYLFTEEFNFLHVAIFLGSYVFYRISGGRVNRNVVSKFLVAVSLFFIIVNATFAIIFTSIFHTIISMLWLTTLILAILFR